jgi:catechol 2,3-dioxygenase-like lactoylglutathione lyase family enzyme
MTVNPTQTLRNIAQALVAPGDEWDAQGVPEIVGVDLDASLLFYEAIGFRTERRTGPFAVMNGFGMRIFLAQDPGATIDSRWVNIRILVPNADVVWECVRALGLPIVHDISGRPFGLRDFVVRDPSGFEIRFAQVIGKHGRP